MWCLLVGILCAANIQACPDPQTLVHIQNYDGPIIVHSTSCEPQFCNLNNQNNLNNQVKYETECTCVTKQCNPYTTQGYSTSNYGCCNQFCNIDDLKAYPVVDNGCNYNNYNRYGNNYPYQCSGYYPQ